ncbi:MAG: 16S rRNA (guanine(966)-N(2))-methyltransferase RsmD [Oscillospiraceae bacterium]|nr:16S rRNA (guanine(966)-N(2))-methyltransferase RsmD [Oscillospiraceae bacterium]
MRKDLAKGACDIRVITGLARGRRLEAPQGWNTRPTSARVKEAAFSIIQFETPGARVLDLFSGTGQMGIEALSRGAGQCVFVENARESLAVLRKNLETSGPWQNAKIMPTDAVGYLKGLERGVFDIALLDPPYAAGLLADCLKLLAEKMRPGGVVLCEADARLDLPESIPPLMRKKSYKYGSTRLFHYRVSDDQGQGERH